MITHEFQRGTVHLLRLPTGSDIVTEITRFAVERGIEAAWIGFLGAVRRAALRYYDQNDLMYRDFTIHRHLEVLSGVGNISRFEGRPFLHAHAVFGDAEGRAFGGHLGTGCEVFALEVRLEELYGAAPERAFDETTGLTLWQPPQGASPPQA
jgi:uncharacterized protein